MVIFGELFRALAILVNGVFQILYWLLFARIVISWLPVDPYHSIVQFLMQVTEPLLAPLRRLPLQIGMIDLTPLVAFVILFFLRNVLVAILVSLAARCGAAF
ncbi:MAG: YggT family protein [Candidatus Omnitrophota bacterium]